MHLHCSRGASLIALSSLIFFFLLLLTSSSSCFFFFSFFLLLLLLASSSRSSCFLLLLLLLVSSSSSCFFFFFLLPPVCSGFGDFIRTVVADALAYERDAGGDAHQQQRGRGRGRGASDDAASEVPLWWSFPASDDPEVMPDPAGACNVCVHRIVRKHAVCLCGRNGK